MALKRKPISVSRAKTIGFWCCFPCSLLAAIVCCIPTCGKSCGIIIPGDNPARKKAEQIASAACSTPLMINEGDAEQVAAFHKLELLGIQNVWDPMHNFDLSSILKSVGKISHALNNPSSNLARDPIDVYKQMLTDRIFDVLDENDMGYLKSEGYISNDNIRFIGTELQKSIFSQLPEPADFHRAADGHREPEYLDGLLAGVLVKIISRDFIEMKLGAISDHLQRQHDAIVLVQDRQNALFVQGAKSAINYECKHEVVNHINSMR